MYFQLKIIYIKRFTFLIIIYIYNLKCAIIKKNYVVGNCSFLIIVCVYISIHIYMYGDIYISPYNAFKGSRGCCVFSVLRRLSGLCVQIGPTCRTTTWWSGCSSPTWTRCAPTSWSRDPMWVLRHRSTRLAAPWKVCTFVRSWKTWKSPGI